MAARLEERITIRLPASMADGLRGAATLHGRGVAAELRAAAAAWIDATAGAMNDHEPPAGAARGTPAARRRSDARE